MNVLGIIAEYNPFHNGHLYHLQQCRERSKADFVVAVMSGDFTQRGEPALLDKWTRSRLAVECGIDAVLELPFAYTVNSAEYFARGGIGILSRLGCVTHLGFGAETENLKELEQIASFLAVEKDSFREYLKNSMSKGHSYARSRELALAYFLGEKKAKLSVSPNNILGIEYLKQLKIQDNTIIPIMVNRKGAGYHDEAPRQGIASATAIRKHMDPEKQAMFVPEVVAGSLLDSPQPSERYFDLIRSTILQKSPEELSGIFSVSEGLENRIRDQVRRCGSLEELAEQVASRRYPKSRILRILCQMVMGLTDFENHYYARILAASQNGTKLLRYIKKSACIPVITNINKEEKLPDLIAFDILAGDVYNLICGNDLYKESDYVRHPYIQRDKTLEIP